jgi:chaperonin GroES
LPRIHRIRRPPVKTGRKRHGISTFARPRRVKRLEGEEKTKGGIIIPDTVKEKPQEGKVIAVGPGGRDEAGKLAPLDVKAGDRILFGKWSGTEVKIDGDDLVIMKESDILGVVA